MIILKLCGVILPILAGQKYNSLRNYLEFQDDFSEIQPPSTLEGPSFQSSRDPSEMKRRKTNCTCGVILAPHELESRINDVDVAQHRFSYMVAIMKKIDFDIYCGGSLITPWHIITAGHCTHGHSIDSILLGLGGDTLNDMTKYGVSSIVLHPGFDDTRFKNDISIIVPEKEVELSILVRPICLSFDKVDLTGQHVKAIGWGKTRYKGKSPSTLLETDLKIMDLEACRKIFETTDGPLDPKGSQICVVGNFTGTCHGDSGGPIAWIDPEINAYVLSAAVSYSIGCAQFPTVCSSIPAFHQWIQSTIAATTPPGENAQVCMKI